MCTYLSTDGAQKTSCVTAIDYAPLRLSGTFTGRSSGRYHPPPPPSSPSSPSSPRPLSHPRSGEVRILGKESRKKNLLDARQLLFAAPGARWRSSPIRGLSKRRSGGVAKWTAGGREPSCRHTPLDGPANRPNSPPPFYRP